MAICLACLVWPLYPRLAGRVEPLVLGLPFGLAWNVGWVTLTFLALCVYHATGREED